MALHRSHSCRQGSDGGNVITTNPAQLMFSGLKFVHVNRGRMTLERLEFVRDLWHGILVVEVPQWTEPCWICSTDLATWLSDLSMFIDSQGNAIGYRDRFFRKLAVPMMAAQACLNDLVNPHRKMAAISKLSAMPVCSWKDAMTLWINQQPEYRDANSTHTRRP